MIIYMRSVPGEPDHRALTRPLYLKMMEGPPSFVPEGFVWDGSSVPFLFQGIFPRHKHPIASCRHDYRCQQAKNARERAWADREFEKDVGSTSFWVTKKIAYIGVRIGAFFGIGSNYK